MLKRTDFPIFYLQGSPGERGRDYGLKCKHLIENSVAFYRRLFEDESGLSWQAAMDYAAQFKPYIADYDPEIMEEIEGIASGAEKVLDEILALNTRTELMFLHKTHRPASCSSLTAMPETNPKGKIYLAQNWDWYRLSRDFCVVLCIDQEDRPKILQTVEAGLIAKMGLNAAGIGLCTNALVTDQWRIGVPYHVLLRGILNARTLADAIGAVTKPKRASAGNYMIAHQDGLALNLEASPLQAHITRPEHGIMVHANHCKAPLSGEKDLIPSLWPDSIVRDLRLEQLLKRSAGCIDLETIMMILRDHFDAPTSICTHPEAELPPNEQSQSNASMILDLQNLSMHLAKGLPCEHEFAEIQLHS